MNVNETNETDDNLKSSSSANLFDEMHSLFALHHTPHEYFVCHNPRSARLYFKNKSQDLLTGTWRDQGVSELHQELQEMGPLDYFETPLIIHFFYEWAKCLNPHQFPDLGDEVPLAIQIHYQRVSLLSELPLPSPAQKPSLKKRTKIALELQTAISAAEYQKSFEKIRQQLINGNCYQVNYTANFHYSYQDEFTALDFYRNLWRLKNKRGVLAHGTYIPLLSKILLSNTPECLFELKPASHKKKKILVTRPIKGTIVCQSASEVSLQWKKLRESRKNHAELTMIVDLMRNDLSKIERPNSVVSKLKKKIRVPGLLHQYQEVKVTLSERVNYYDILKAIYPGGSVTGAPKVMAMNLISQLEGERRGFYCGSTLFLYQKKSMASLNIRSAEVSLMTKEISLGAGGGITLLSENNDEFQEMKQKASSFVDLFS